MAQLARESIPITPPHVVIQADARAVDPISRSAPKAAWRYLSWLGLVLVVVGGVDVVSRWYPVVFGSPEWEFGTIAVTIASLPLLTIGLSAMLASFLARAVRSGVIGMAAVFVCMSLGVIALIVLFMLDVPLALRVSNAAAALELRKTIVRTLIMGAAFAALYVSAGVVSFRYLSGRLRDA